MSTFVTLIIFRFFNYYHFDPCHISQKGESNILYFRIRLGVPSKKNRPNRREEGQLHFKKLKRNNFLTKVGEGGVTKHIVKNRSTLFCMFYYSIWPNQFPTTCGNVHFFLRLPSYPWVKKIFSSYIVPNLFRNGAN